MNAIGDFHYIACGPESDASMVYGRAPGGLGRPPKTTVTADIPEGNA
jgi:hypothetical protein